jgi:hypothetical protein
MIRGFFFFTYRMYSLLFGSALALDLTQEQLSQWNTLKSMSARVADRDCSGEIISIIEKSSSIYGQAGLSENFLKSLEDIKTVSGDIPEAVEFRNELNNVTSVFTEFYKQQLEIQKSIEQAQKTTTTSVAEYPTHTLESVAKETEKVAAPAEEDSQVQVQSVGGKENPVYGVMSGAKQAGLALTGLGMLAALFL